MKKLTLKSRLGIFFIGIGAGAAGFGLYRGDMDTLQLLAAGGLITFGLLLYFYTE